MCSTLVQGHQLQHLQPLELCGSDCECDYAGSTLWPLLMRHDHVRATAQHWNKLCAFVQPYENHPTSARSCNMWHKSTRRFIDVDGQGCQLWQTGASQQLADYAVEFTRSELLSLLRKRFLGTSLFLCSVCSTSKASTQSLAFLCVYASTKGRSHRYNISCFYAIPSANKHHTRPYETVSNF